MDRKKATLLDLGQKSYSDTYKIQMELVENRINRKINDTLIFVEHPPVITIGRGGTHGNLLLSSENLKEKNVELFETNRGGDITYHGPGQLVGYPIFDLTNYGKDLHLAVRNYEEAIIRALACYNLKTGRIDGLTGVWSGNQKIAAIGVGVRKWVTFHGFALNVNDDLTPFSYIVPCGITDKGITSMKILLGREVEMAEVKTIVAESFADVFNLEYN
jgi:lipoyl(octanoyl) transferase